MNIAHLIDELAQQGVHLWVEGTRVRFRAPRGALGGEQRAALASHRTEVAAMLRERAAAQRREAPLSYGQRSLWLVHQDDPDSAAYNVAFAARVSSAVDVDALQDAVQALGDRHAILRTTYPLRDGRPVQHIAGQAAARLDTIELPGADESALRERVLSDYRKPFDLAEGPVWRTALYSFGPTDHVLVFTAHHIAIDGWSLLLVLDELRTLYREAAAGVPAMLTRPELEYADYVAWQQQLLGGPDGQRLAVYWQDQLAAPRAQIELPTDRPRPSRRRVRGATLEFPVDPALAQGLQQLAKDRGTTLFVVLLAAFKVLLHRYTGTEDVVVGTPMLGREKAEFSRIMGHFVNPVPLRSRVDPQARFDELLLALRQTLLDAIECQEYPLALMVERLQPTRDPARSPLFETIFVLQRFEQFGDLNELLSAPDDGAATDFGGLRIRPYALAQQEGQFDLSLGMVERGAGLSGSFKYNAALFDPSTVERLARHYVTLLASIVNQPSGAIGRLALLDAHEREMLIRAAGSGRPEAVAGEALHRQFEAQVRREPAAIAVSCDAEQLTYDALNRRANRLAHRLVALGVRTDTLVGLCVERGVDLVVALLGILKAGGAYLPIDLAYPAERVAFMLEDAQAPVLVTQRSLVGRLPEGRAAAVCIDDVEALSDLPDSDPDVATGPDDLIYAIYTSGSTGKPKGTLLTHRAVDRLFRATQPWHRFDATDVWTMFHSVAFDFSVWELWGALIHGGRLVVVPYLTSRSPAAFLELIERESVTVLNQTPSAFRQLMLAEQNVGGTRMPSLRHVVFGGEALSLESLRPWFERHGDQRPRLVNMYGITETCVHVSYRPIAKSDLDAGRGSVIGVPIPDLTLHVLDPEMEPVPFGVAGEMYVGGPGLARGYLGRPDLTAQRFVADPFRPGERLYRTGDLARRHADGELEYLGRIDQQVKIRGFRIELGEIEAALMRDPRISQCAVLAGDDGSGSRHLVAYVVAREGAPVDPASLRESLRGALPAYMVPAHFVGMAELPLTRNGKIDVAALPTPGEAPAPDERPGAHAEPTSHLEFQLLALWQQVLGNPALGLDDNFFDHGGHSLSAVELLLRIEQVYGRKLPLATLFQAPSVAQMAQLLRSSDWVASWRSLVAINPGGTSVPMFMVPGVGGNVLMFGKLSKLLGPGQPLYGLQARGLDGKEEPFRSIHEMAEHYLHEIRAVRPQGPYFVAGTCTGGVIAYEIAQRLAATDEVRLVLLETWPPAVARAQRGAGRVLGPMRYLLAKGWGYAKEMRSLPMRDWPGFVRRKLSVGRQMFNVGLKQTLEGSTFYVEKVVDATLQAVARYEPRPYPGGLLNVIAIDRPLPSPDLDTRRTWENLARGPSRAVMIHATDSGKLFVSPHVELVATLLRDHGTEEPRASGSPASSAAPAIDTRTAEGRPA